MTDCVHVFHSSVVALVDMNVTDQQKLMDLLVNISSDTK